ncbi:zinc finger protein 208-like [Oppia nitens]|uniref:zinc finger protein 208-like n=1 Tax=Oppia nitens TaxID=1686743 RepID=UPI0023DCE546|nr:zinc finger protein 208-like [Oppia nitens]
MSITTTTTITNNKPTDVLSLSTDVVDNDDNRQTVSKQHKPIKRQKRWVRPKYKEMSDDDDDDYVNNDNNNYYSDSNSYTDNADTTATTVTTTENPMDPKQCKYFDKDLNKYVCPQCDRRLDREKQIYRHLHIVHKVERPCICFYPDCDKTYANRQYLDRHLEAHVRPQIRLPEPESDPNSLLLMKRNNFDETSGQYMCPNPDCELGFPSSRQLYAHFYSQHYIRGEWRCDYPDCSKVYKTKVLLDVHQKIHSDVKPYVCQHPECTNAYRTKAEWKSHQKVHQENRQTYQCPDCEMVCLSEKYLNKHMIYKHSGEKTIKCGIDDCEEMFHFPYQRTRHRKKVHNVKYAPDKRIVRECQWPGCEYRTDHCTKLKTHMRKHTGERVACQWPGCEFTTTSDTLVKEHMRRHTGERPYECQWPDCGKRFRTYKIYRTHYDIHRNHKPFVCDWPGCDYRSNSKGNLYTHKRTHEKDKYPTKPRIRPSRAKTANKSQLLSSAKKLSPKKLVKSHVIVTGTDSTGADSGGGGGGGIIGGDLPQEGSTTTTTAATIAHLSQLFQNAH